MVGERDPSSRGTFGDIVLYQEFLGRNHGQEIMVNREIFHRERRGITGKQFLGHFANK
jgi:hypothetical protein